MAGRLFRLGESEAKEGDELKSEITEEYVHFDENIDLTEYPAVIDPKGYPPGTKLTFGDSHGNPLNVIHFAIRRGLFVLDERGLAESKEKYARLVTIFKTLNHVARNAATDSVARDEAARLAEEFDTILKQGTLKEGVTFNWSGDNLSDRGGYDKRSTDALNAEEYDVELDTKADAVELKEASEEVKVPPKKIILKKKKKPAEEFYTELKIYARSPRLADLTKDSTGLGAIGIVIDEKKSTIKVSFASSDLARAQDFEIKDAGDLIARIKQQKPEDQRALLKKEILEHCLKQQNPEYEFYTAYWLDEKEALQSKPLSQRTASNLTKGIYQENKDGEARITSYSKHQIISECGLGFTPWGNDLLNLIVFDKFGMSGEFSNHDQNALKILDDFLDSKEEKFERKDDKIGLLPKESARTLDYFIKLIENGVITKDKAKELLFKYKLGLKAFTYTYDQSTSPPRLSIRPHGPNAFETIEGMAELYGIPFPSDDKLDMQTLCNIIDKINEKVLDDIISGRIHEKMLKRHQDQATFDSLGKKSIPTKYPLTRLIWNRSANDADIVMHDTLVDGTEVYIEHGHDGPEKSKTPHFTNLDHDTGKRSLTGQEAALIFEFNESPQGSQPPTLEQLKKNPPGKERDSLVVIRDRESPTIKVYYPYNGQVVTKELKLEGNQEIDKLLIQRKAMTGKEQEFCTGLVVKKLIDTLNIPYQKVNTAPFAQSSGAHTKEHKLSAARLKMLDALKVLNRQDDEKSASPEYVATRDRLFDAIECADIDEGDLPLITELFQFIQKERETKLESYEERTQAYSAVIEKLKKYPEIYHWADVFRHDLYLLIAQQKVTRKEDKVIQQYKLHFEKLKKVLALEKSKFHPLFYIANSLAESINFVYGKTQDQTKLKLATDVLIWLTDTLEKPHRFRKLPYPLTDGQESLLSPHIKFLLEQFKKTDEISSTYPTQLVFGRAYLLNEIVQLAKTLNEKKDGSPDGKMGARIIAGVKLMLKEKIEPHNFVLVAHLLELTHQYLVDPANQESYHALISLLNFLPQGSGLRVGLFGFNTKIRQNTAPRSKKAIELKLDTQEQYDIACFQLHKAFTYGFKNDHKLKELKSFYKNIFDEITKRKNWNEEQLQFFILLFQFFENSSRREPTAIPATLSTSLLAINDLGLPKPIADKLIKHFEPFFVPNVDQIEIKETLSEQARLILETGLLHKLILVFNKKVNRETGIPDFKTEEEYAEAFLKWYQVSSNIPEVYAYFEITEHDKPILKNIIKNAFQNFAIVQKRVQPLLGDRKIEEEQEFAESKLNFSSYEFLSSKDFADKLKGKSKDRLLLAADTCWNEAVGLAVKDYLKDKKPSAIAERLPPIVTPELMRDKKIISDHLGQKFKVPCGVDQLRIVIQNLVPNAGSTAFCDYAGQQHKETKAEYIARLLNIRANFQRGDFDILMLQEVHFDAIAEVGYPDDYESDEKDPLLDLSKSEKGFRIFKAWLKLPQHFQFIMDETKGSEPSRNGLVTIYDSTKFDLVHTSLNTEKNAHVKKESKTYSLPSEGITSLSSEGILSVKLKHKKSSKIIVTNNIHGDFSSDPSKHEEAIRSLHHFEYTSVTNPTDIILTGGDFNAPIFPTEHVYQENSTSLCLSGGRSEGGEVFSSVDGLFCSTGDHETIQQVSGECLDYRYPGSVFSPITIDPKDPQLLSGPYKTAMFSGNHALYSVEVKQLEQKLKSENPDIPIRVLIQKNKHNAYQIQIQCAREIPSLAALKDCECKPATVQETKAGALSHYYTLKPLENDQHQKYLFKLVEKCLSKTKVLTGKQKVLNNIFKQMVSLSKSNDSVSAAKLKHLRDVYMKLSAFNQFSDFQACDKLRQEIIELATKDKDIIKFNRKFGYWGARFWQGENPKTGTTTVLFEASQFLFDAYNEKQKSSESIRTNKYR